MRRERVRCKMSTWARLTLHLLIPVHSAPLSVQREGLPATMSERVRYARKASTRVSYAPASESSDSDSDADGHEKPRAGSAGKGLDSRWAKRRTAEQTLNGTQVAPPASRARVPLPPTRTATRRTMKAKLPRSRAKSAPKRLLSTRRTPNKARKGRKRADSSRESRSCRSSCLARSVSSLCLLYVDVQLKQRPIDIADLLALGSCRPAEPSTRQQALPPPDHRQSFPVRLGYRPPSPRTSQRRRYY